MGFFEEKSPRNPKVQGGDGDKAVKMFEVGLGMGETSISGTFGGKIPKNPVFWGGDRGKNLGDFPHTNVYTTLVPIKIALD